MKTLLSTFVLFQFFIATSQQLNSSDGYELWLRYERLTDDEVRKQYNDYFTSVYVEEGDGPLTVAKEELAKAVPAMLGNQIKYTDLSSASLIIARLNAFPPILKNIEVNTKDLGKEGYAIKNLSTGDKRKLLVTATTDIGLLYGTFELIRQMQLLSTPSQLDIVEVPKVDLRVLNHWDNLDRTVERGYAGFSIWNWHKLPEYMDDRYVDYARANASVGINGTVLTNVNANALVLTPHYLEKVEALADLFRSYGIRVYLTARFSAPMEIGGLETADPLDENVKKWWKEKADEIYAIIPDFGGFLVKANSEGQPGPQNYGRNHVDGANMLADAVAPHGGIVMWRAFVYSEHDPTDRAKQAYDEFVPHDGEFRNNVLIQVKNGAIDFQPREPFHPMFGAMPKTPLMMEFQITKEYLGFSTHLVFLPKLYEEVLQSDTYQKGEGSTVAQVIDGSTSNKSLTGMAGVANIGTDRNWTGHVFAQADWYGFGKLAWNPELSSEKIAEDWLRLTFTNDKNFVNPMKDLLLKSREAVVKYMTPLGLHHMMATGHHYGPGPWIDDLSRPEWNPVYYHKADKEGIGFDRTASGSNATSQYAAAIAEKFNAPETTPEQLLLWFHHLPWDYKMKNGKTLWSNLGLTYQEGVDEVREMQQTWQNMKSYVDERRFREVASSLEIQLKEAIWWKDACMSYFQQFSKMDFPEGMKKPEHDLAYYKSLSFPYAPGIRPRW